MRLLYTASLLFISSFAFSQSLAYHPMLENNKTWDVFSGEAGWIVPFTQGSRYFVQGSGPYQGQEYQEIWNQVFIPTQAPVFVPPFELGSPVPFGLMREDTMARKVYFRLFQFDWSLSDERLIYDFNLPVGDSIQMESHVWYVLDSIVMTTIENGESRRKFHFHATDGAFGPTFYIEGVGGKNGFAYPLIEYFESNDDLVCVKRQGEVLYSDGQNDACNFISATGSPESEKISVFPNPVRQAFNIALPPGLYDQVRLYAPGGRLLGTWALTPNDASIAIPVENIPNGPFWGVLVGGKRISYFKSLKIQ